MEISYPKKEIQKFLSHRTHIMKPNVHDIIVTRSCYRFIDICNNHASRNNKLL